MKTTMRSLIGVLTAMLGCLLCRPAEAQDFYAGKTVKITASSDAGGGYDIYARLLARHLTKYLPGLSSAIVQNMPGGGGLRGARYVYQTAPKDGTEFGEVHATAMLDSILGVAGKEIDPAKFVWIGSMASDTDVCSYWHTTGIRTFKDMHDRDTVIGGVGKSTQSFTFPNIINHVLGTKMKIILGYNGTGDRLTALERGEIAGSCGINGSTLMSVGQRQIESGELLPVVQSGLRPHPSLPNVPLTQSFAQTEEQKTILEVIFSQMEIARVFAAPPELSPERSADLRGAFMKAMADRELNAEADKMKISIIPMAGPEVQVLIGRLAATPDDLKAKIIAANAE